ncbi:O-antigen ligase family protein [Priestia megaterium]|uniref:O-antigen ligase family protein n=1 Tax=Priestia megaterium TaxID=1404 RepID=UPI000BFE84D5|nr:O-antigen ligase family protein [Priestia megaterium]PGR00703.1 hypothetical protein COA23_24210 [Priestia megaterium]
MSFFLMIFSLLVKRFIPFTGNQYLAELPLYLFVLLVLIYLVTGKRVYFKDTINTKVCLFIVISLGLQLIAILSSYGRIDNPIYNKNPISGLIGFMVFLGFLFLHYIIVKILVSNNREIELFLKGAFWSTIILLFVTYLQYLYLLLPNSPVSNLVALFGKVFESRNNYTPEWYVNGSYVQTVNRINGFFSEPGNLAGHLSIICLPFILAAIKNKFDIFKRNKKYSALKYYFLLFAIIGMLLLAKTSTGLVAIIVVLILFWITLPLMRKLTFGFIILLLVVVFFYEYHTNPYVYSLVDEFVFGKSDSSSTDNRLGGTLGLLYTFLHHPITGIGNGYYHYYLEKYIPAWSKFNSEYINFASIRHSFPIMSIILGWLAQYGILIVTFFIVYIIKLVKGIHRLINKLGKDSSDYLFYKTIGDAATLFFLIFFTLSFLGFGWSESAFLILFFFFVVFRQYLKRITK